VAAIRTKSMEETKGYKEEHVGEAERQDKLSREEHTERKSEERLKKHLKFKQIFKQQYNHEKE
jgi:hypothetical protein